MTVFRVTSPLPYYFDEDGEALDSGYLWFGVKDLDPKTNPVPVYWDEAKTIIADQPIRTLNGVPVRNGDSSNIFTEGEFSETVENKNNVLIRYNPNGVAFSAETIKELYRSNDNVIGSVDFKTVAELQSYGVPDADNDITSAYILEGLWAGKNITWDANSTGGFNTITPAGGGATGRWVVQLNDIYPEDFGAKGDGLADDTQSFKDWAQFGKDNQCVISCKVGSKYRITDTIWFGTDNAFGGIRGVEGRGAVILPEIDNKPVFDLTGVENGKKLFLRDFRSEEFTGEWVSTCFFLMARPKRSSGVVSSGNAVITGNTIYGHFSCACYLNVQSESNLIGQNHFFNYNKSGHGMAFVRHDYFEDTIVIEYDNLSGGNFTAGNTINIGGATAKIIRPVDTLGKKMWVHVLSGTFADNNTITDGGVTASVNMPDRIDVIGKASPSTALGIEDDSTASLQSVKGNFCNIVNPESTDQCIFISDWIDINVSDENNLNHTNNLGDLIHFQSDQTKNPAKSTGVYVHIKDNYLHATHRNSITFGDPVSGGGNQEMVIKRNLSAGAPSVMENRVAYVGNPSNVGNAYASIIETDLGVDLRGVNFQNANIFSVQDPLNGHFYADKLIEGELSIESNTNMQITSPDEINRLKVNYINLSLSNYGGQKSETINAAGEITINGKVITVNKPGGGGDLITIKVDDDAVPFGDSIYIRPVGSANPINLKHNDGNIKMVGGSDLLLNDPNVWTKLTNFGTFWQNV